MTEKDLISRIKELREIKPKKDWVILAKSQILEQEVKSSQKLFVLPRIFFGYKPALATITCLMIFFGLFAFAQNSVPGDLLFSVKKVTEMGRAVFISEEERPQMSLELADKRLEELTRIAQANQVRKLAPAINEFQASVSEATKNLSKLDATTSDPIVVKKAVDKTKELEEKVEEARYLLGVHVGEQEISELQGISAKLELKLLLPLLEKDSEQGALTQEQEESFNQIKELAQEGKYPEALKLYSLVFEQVLITEEPTEGEEGEEEGLEQEKAEKEESATTTEKEE